MEVRTRLGKLQSKYARREVVHGFSHQQDEMPNYEFPYQKPVNKQTAWHNFQVFCCDVGRTTCMGRTPHAWRRVLYFYIVFFSALALLCYLCGLGLMASLHDDYPTYQLEDSIIGVNPGLVYRPLSRNEDESSVIFFNPYKPETVEKYIKLMDEFLEPYTNISLLLGAGRSQVVCDFDSHPPEGKACAVDLNNLGQCSRENFYGYRNLTPCVFLKLNKIYGWRPKVYNNVNYLPKEMPEKLKKYIQDLPEVQREQIWVSCYGANPADDETIGKVEFVTSMGFHTYYYPYMNQKEYLNPLVVIRLLNPAVNRLFNVVCRTWAKNLKFHAGTNRNTREGMVLFEFLINTFPDD